MKVVIQRVSKASVKIGMKLHSEILKGLLVFVGIETSDTKEDILWLSKKIINMRIFEDKSKIMNNSIKDINGEILIVSQFTLHASTKKGNRPSYIKSAKPEVAITLYKEFVSKLESDFGKKVETGIFGADMKINLVNEGPITIILDSKERL